jgi:hypothetical protein
MGIPDIHCYHILFRIQRTHTGLVFLLLAYYFLKRVIFVTTAFFIVAFTVKRWRDGEAVLLIRLHMPKQL